MSFSSNSHKYEPYIHMYIDIYTDIWIPAYQHLQVRYRNMCVIYMSVYIEYVWICTGYLEPGRSKRYSFMIETFWPKIFKDRKALVWIKRCQIWVKVLFLIFLSAENQKFPEIRPKIHFFLTKNDWSHDGSTFA